ncbi:MAG: hypothetical protein Ct9H300mP21_09550 [Pseudomonadota bacterium]|nr:MAG: hypothetical protein Ct9H300mP21_09550 [Pseudomonadota bacterium]
MELAEHLGEMQAKLVIIEEKRAEENETLQKSTDETSYFKNDC